MSIIGHLGRGGRGRLAPQARLTAPGKWSTADGSVAPPHTEQTAHKQNKVLSLAKREPTKSLAEPVMSKESTSNSYQEEFISPT